MQPPEHLNAVAKSWWGDVMATFDLDDYLVPVMTKTAEALHRAEEARATIDNDGACVTDRWGQIKAHPMIAVERDARTAFLRGVRELALDDSPTPDPRPPRRSSGRR